tara:strand:- start:678 stop:818 length:141 start_codon:yes stop_codon:yes gene_type:complete
MAKALTTLKIWLSEALEFTLGSPTAHTQLPPSIGTQPYHDKPAKAH